MMKVKFNKVSESFSDQITVGKWYKVLDKVPVTIPGNFIVKFKTCTGRPLWMLTAGGYLSNYTPLEIDFEPVFGASIPIRWDWTFNESRTEQATGRLLRTHTAGGSLANYTPLEIDFEPDLAENTKPEHVFGASIRWDPAFNESRTEQAVAKTLQSYKCRIFQNALANHGLEEPIESTFCQMTRRYARYAPDRDQPISEGLKAVKIRTDRIKTEYLWGIDRAKKNPTGRLKEARSIPPPHQTLSNRPVFDASIRWDPASSAVPPHQTLSNHPVLLMKSESVYKTDPTPSLNEYKYLLDQYCALGIIDEDFAKKKKERYMREQFRNEDLAIQDYVQSTIESQEPLPLLITEWSKQREQFRNEVVSNLYPEHVAEPSIIYHCDLCEEDAKYEYQIREHYLKAHKLSLGRALIGHKSQKSLRSNTKE
jgi:hypothetical protein